jgi:predicted nucleotidyltransferase
LKKPLTKHSPYVAYSSPSMLLFSPASRTEISIAITTSLLFNYRVETMHSSVREKLDELRRLCDKHRVLKLEIFGSASIDEDGEREPRDLDFLVEFRDMSPVEHADAYFGLLEDLQNLFRKQIDLVEIRAVRNRYFLESIEPTRRALYAA